MTTTIRSIIIGLIIATAILISFAVGYDIAHGEELPQATIIVLPVEAPRTVPEQLKAELPNVEWLSDIAVIGVFSDAQLDDLAGYDDVAVLRYTTYLSTVQH